MAHKSLEGRTRAPAPRLVCLWWSSDGAHHYLVFHQRLVERQPQRLDPRSLCHHAPDYQLVSCSRLGLHLIFAHQKLTQLVCRLAHLFLILARLGDLWRSVRHALVRSLTTSETCPNCPPTYHAVSMNSTPTPSVQMQIPSVQARSAQATPVQANQESGVDNQNAVSNGYFGENLYDADSSLMGPRSEQGSDNGSKGG